MQWFESTRRLQKLHQRLHVVSSSGGCRMGTIGMPGARICFLEPDKRRLLEKADEILLGVVMFIGQFYERDLS